MVTFARCHFLKGLCHRTLRSSLFEKACAIAHIDRCCEIHHIELFWSFLLRAKHHYTEVFSYTKPCRITSINAARSTTLSRSWNSFIPALPLLAAHFVMLKSCTRCHFCAITHLDRCCEVHHIEPFLEPVYTSAATASSPFCDAKVMF